MGSYVKQDIKATFKGIKKVAFLFRQSINGLRMDRVKLSKLHKDIAVICDYLAYDEKRHFEESGRPQNHIWCSVKRTKQWIQNNSKQLSRR